MDRVPWGWDLQVALCLVEDPTCVHCNVLLQMASPDGLIEHWLVQV